MLQEMQHTYMAVGTRVGSSEDDLAMEEERPAGRWGGRLLLFRLTHRDASPADDARHEVQLECVDEREFQSGVHALCWQRCSQQIGCIRAHALQCSLVFAGLLGEVPGIMV